MDGNRGKKERGEEIKRYKHLVAKSMSQEYEMHSVGHTLNNYIIFLHSDI